MSETAEGPLVSLKLKIQLGVSSTGDQHYDTISAFHKSLRFSKENAALYYLARMLNGGEDPRFIARRLMVDQ